METLEKVLERGYLQSVTDVQNLLIKNRLDEEKRVGDLYGKDPKVMRHILYDENKYNTEGKTILVEGLYKDIVCPKLKDYFGNNKNIYAVDSFLPREIKDAYTKQKENFYIVECDVENVTYYAGNGYKPIPGSEIDKFVNFEKSDK